MQRPIHRLKFGFSERRDAVSGSAAVFNCYRKLIVNGERHKVRAFEACALFFSVKSGSLLLGRPTFSVYYCCTDVVIDTTPVHEEVGQV